MLFATADAVLAKYPLHVTATPNASLLCLSSQPLPEEVRAAVAASAERLGYGSSNVAWVVVAPEGGSPTEACALPFAENDIRTIVEGIDPVAVVVADSNAAAMMAEAYKQPLFCYHPCRVAGRSVAPFTNFEALLTTPDSKQKAWALLKELALG